MTGPPANTHTLSLDASGNRTSTVDNVTTTSYTRNNLNQYSAVSGLANPTYDGNGNLKTYNGWSYTYDAMNRLTAAVNGSAGANFWYDGLGRICTWQQNGPTNARFNVWDGWDLVAEYTLKAASNLPDTEYLHGAGSDELVSMTRAGVTSYFFQDGRGNTAQATDTSGNLVETCKYDVHGAPTVTVAAGKTATGNRFLFTGREYFSVVGLYNYRNRFYLPTLGRFLQPDPIGFSGDPANLYRYCGNNPVNWSDPTGLYAGVDDAAFALGGALVGLLGQGVSDFWSGQLSSWQAYTGAAIGGAIGGVTVEYAGPVFAGIAGAAASDLATQGLQIASGNQQQLNLRSTAIAAVIGGLTGRIGSPAVPGLNSGRNSYNAIFNQMRTKFQNGTIRTVTPKTAAKMALGRLHHTGAVTGTFVGSTGGVFISSLPANPAGPDQSGQSSDMPTVSVSVDGSADGGTHVTYGDPDGVISSGQMQVVDPEPPAAADDQ